jgi:hypothetical protein
MCVALRSLGIQYNTVDNQMNAWLGFFGLRIQNRHHAIYLV